MYKKFKKGHLLNGSNLSTTNNLFFSIKLFQFEYNKYWVKFSCFVFDKMRIDHCSLVAKWSFQLNLSERQSIGEEF